MENKRLQTIFLHMKDRCYNPNNKQYKDYGGRGINIYEEWYTPHSHKGGRVFKKWALENGYADNLTIDRIDVNKGYSPENCRWVSMKEQQNNKRNNRVITYKGKTQTIAQWSRETGIPFKTIQNRLNRHLPAEKVLSKIKLYSEAFNDPKYKKRQSERVKAFMSDPIKKENWKKSLSKRYNHL